MWSAGLCGKQARPVHKVSLCNAQGRRNPRGAKLVSLKKFYNIKGALIKFCTGALEGLGTVLVERAKNFLGITLGSDLKSG